MARAKGIDVSHHMPISEFAGLRNQGIYFVGVKATEGNTFVDPKFSHHQVGLRRMGNGYAMDLVIYYHFARSGDPQKQALRLMNTVGRLAANERLCLDLEGSLPAEPSRVLQWVEDFYVPILDEYPMMKQQLIYTSARVWRSFGNPDWTEGFVKNIALWAPRYNNSGWEPVPPKPWEKVGWTIWQYSDGETPPSHVNGVGNCDTNLWNGDLNALKSWLQPYDLLSSIVANLHSLTTDQLTSLHKQVGEILNLPPGLPESPFKV